ncbi:hypothetical protein J6590_093530 [Homalodisca vitripennis]|nr:hypothetical protein J6590_093530 [Homalodisca vitripennis]
MTICTSLRTSCPSKRYAGLIKRTGGVNSTKVRTDNVALPIIYTGSNPSCRRPLFGEAESPGKLEPQSALAALCQFASGWAESVLQNYPSVPPPVSEWAASRLITPVTRVRILDEVRDFCTLINNP